jgi:hypothetical protein
MADINIKAQIQVDTGDSAKKVEGVQNAVKNTGAGVKDAGAQFGKLKGELGALSPALGQASQGVGALTQAFNILKANPIIGVFALIAGLVVALFQKFKQMEGVADSLGKAFGTLSGVFNTFINGILTPLIDGFTWLIENVTGGLISVLSALGVTTEKTAQRFGEITEALDDLEDAQKNSAIATAEANRKLQEAREIAADANVPVKERIAALKEAARIEKEESDKVIAINQTKARLLLESMAIELGARADVIKSIREGSIESLKAARLELMNMKNVDKEKLSQIDAMIIAAEDAAASSAKIAKKTQGQITSIEKEESDKREAIRKANEEKRKKAHEDELARIKKERDAYWDRIAAGRLGEEEQTAIDNRRKESIKTIDPVVKGSMEANLQAIGTVSNANTEAALKKKKLDDEEAANVEMREQSKRDALRGTGEALNAVGEIIGKQTVAGKALGTATALINTFLGITEIWRNKTVLPEPFGTISKVAATVTAAASGFAAVRGIMRTNVPGGGGGGGQSIPSVSSATPPVQPQALGMQLNSASIQGIGNAAAGGVNRAFVLDTDINDSQERQARLQRAARLG